MKKLRLWLIKKLNAIPNEELHKLQRMPSIKTSELHIIPIYAKCNIEKNDFSVYKDDVKKAVIEGMIPELVPYLTFIDEHDEIVARINVVGEVDKKGDIKND